MYTTSALLLWILGNENITTLILKLTKIKQGKILKKLFLINNGSFFSSFISSESGPAVVIILTLSVTF